MYVRIKKENRQTLSCIECKMEYPPTEFVRKGKNKKSGAIQFSSRCKKCYHRYVKTNKSYNTLAIKNRAKQQFVDDIKKCCAVCGYNKCKRALDLHHIDPNEKEYSIVIMIRQPSCSIEELKQELSKCVVLCSNCHREHHAGLFDATNYPRVICA